jgi:hypothetical protein
MSSSSSSKKRKLSEAPCISEREERDNEIQDLWNQGIKPATYCCLRIRAGIAYAYNDMMTSGRRSSSPPAEDAAEDIWIKQGWVFRNETDQASAIKFPVESTQISRAQWDDLSKEKQGRCVPADRPSMYRCCPRDWVDKVDKDGTVLENYSIANAVRLCQEEELANCRLILDPENRRKCVLVSTRKPEIGEEWKLDINYAHRMLAISKYEQESSSDSSVEIVEHRGSSARAWDPSELEVETSVLNREGLLKLVHSSGNICMHLAAIGNQLYKVNKKLGQLKRQVRALEGTKEDDRDAPPYSPIDHGNESPFDSPREYASP